MDEDKKRKAADTPGQAAKKTKVSIISSTASSVSQSRLYCNGRVRTIFSDTSNATQVQKAWHSKSSKAEDRSIKPGDSGIWVTCHKGKERKCMGELRDLLTEVIIVRQFIEGHVANRLSLPTEWPLKPRMALRTHLLRTQASTTSKRTLRASLRTSRSHRREGQSLPCGRMCLVVSQPDSWVWRTLIRQWFSSERHHR